MRDGHVGAPDGSAAYRPFVPLLAAVAAVAALIGDAGAAIDNVLVVAAVVPFVVWMLRPGFPTLAVVVPTSVAILIATRDSDLEAAMFMVSVAATVVGGYESSTPSFVVGGLVLAAVPLVGLAAFGNDTATGIWVMGVALPMAISRASRRQLELAAELSATRAALADQRVLEERRRIARDVHDSVGHGLAAVLLHITGARHILRRDPDAADEALAQAEDVGRRSMWELRETLGVLRAATSDATSDGPLPPVPGIDEIARDDVWSRFTVTGDVSRLDQVAATSLHRVAEEAFANAHRHAPGATTAAVLDVREHDVVMTIESFGPLHASLDGEHRPRYGIVGMSERMAAVGGAIDVGPTPSGWLVRAAVPLRDPPVGR
jgi:signal transduction histidine kinase